MDAVREFVKPNNFDDDIEFYEYRDDLQRMEQELQNVSRALSYPQKYQLKGLVQTEKGETKGIRRQKGLGPKGIKRQKGLRMMLMVSRHVEVQE